MSLNCLALACSPRKDGNTALLADKVLEECRRAGRKTEYLNINDFNIAPCSACEACSKTGKCIINDDAQVLYKKILAADRLILAAPIFSMGINAQAKMFIDRAQQFWATKYVLGRQVVEAANRPRRYGIFISCAGTDLSGVFDGPVRVAKYFFLMLEIEMLSTLCYSSTDNKGDILNNERAMEEAVKYGQQLCKV